MKKFFSSNEDQNNTGFNFQAMNNIGMGTAIDGNLNCEGDIRIDGRVKGNVTTSGRLVIGISGEIQGDVSCSNANIDGKIIGNVIISEVLKLTKSANIQGIIKTSKIIIEEGAMVEAKITMQ